VIWIVRNETERENRDVSAVNGNQQQERETRVTLKHIAFADANQNEGRNG
jgi:hypothetical protein